MSAWERALSGSGGGSAGTAIRRAAVPRRTTTPTPTTSKPPAAPRFSLPTGALGPGFQPTPQDYARVGGMVTAFGNEFLFGPSGRKSIIGEGQASLPERFARDWGASEQEFRLANENLKQGNLGAAALWGGLGAVGVAGVLPVGRIPAAVRAAARASRAPAVRVNEAFPTQRFADLFDRTPVQVDIPTEYVTKPNGLQERIRSPSNNFGSRANRAEAQIYRGPDGNWTYGSPHDVTVRTPLQGSGVGFRSRNPFEAMRMNPLSVGSDDLMGDYISAVVAARRAGVPTTDIDALLYLMRGGDSGASELFQGVARSGERAPFLRARTSPSFDDIVLAHSSAAPARRDAAGNVLLRAGGDYRTNPFIPAGSESRSAYYPWRSSVHFTQNSRVAEAPLAGSWANNRNFTLARLNDVIEANPGSLGNLNPADTFFFPQQGRPLVLPNARQVELPPRPTGFHERKWDPGKTFMLEDGTTATIDGRYYPQRDFGYESQIDQILRSEAEALGGRWIGIGAEDTAFPQRGVMSEFMQETGTPLLGHGRGSLPGQVEQAAGENAYNAGLGVLDDFFETGINEAIDRSAQEYGSRGTYDAVEFWRRLLAGNNLTGAEPKYFNPNTSGFNF